MKPYIRAHIALETQSAVLDFLRILAGIPGRFIMENKDGSHRVSALSMLGVLYMATEHPKELFLLNEEEDGVFPPALDSFRIYGTPSTDEIRY